MIEVRRKNLPISLQVDIHEHDAREYQVRLWVCKWMDGCMDGWVVGWMNGWMNGWVGEWLDG